MGRVGVQSARATEQELKDPSAAFAADMKDLVDRDDKLLNRQGVTNRGIWRFALDKGKCSLYARNADRRKNQREAYFVLYRSQRFVTGLTPKLRSAIGDETLALYDDYFARGYNGIVNEPAGYDIALRATKMSEALGAFLNRASSIAIKIGKDAALNVDRFNGAAFASPGITPLPPEQRRDEWERDPPRR